MLACEVVLAAVEAVFAVKAEAETAVKGDDIEA